VPGSGPRARAGRQTERAHRRVRAGLRIPAGGWRQGPGHARLDSADSRRSRIAANGGVVPRGPRVIGALLAGLLLALCCYLGVEAVRRHALRRGMLDVPVARSSHSVPVPRGGGLVIVGAALAAGLLISALMGPAVPMLAWLVGGLAIALVGWL